MKTLKLRVALILIALSAQLANHAIAQTRTWTGSPVAAWEVPINWSPLGVPLIDDSVIIGTSAVPDPTVFIDEDNDPSIANLTLNRGATLRASTGGQSGFFNSVLDVSGTTTLNDQSTLIMAVDTNRLVLNDQSRFELKKQATVRDLFTVGSSAEVLLGSGSISPTLWLTDTAGTVLRNNGLIRIDGGPAYIEATNGGLLDLDGSTGNGRLLLEPGANLQVKGALADPFSGTITFEFSSNPLNTPILNIDSDWALDSGGKIEFFDDGEIRGGQLTANGATLDVQANPTINAPVVLENTVVDGPTTLTLKLSDTASLRGSTTLDTIVEVHGAGDITDGDQFAINSNLDFHNTASISNSKIDMRGNLITRSAANIIDSTIAVTDDANATGVIAYQGPLSIGGDSDISVKRISDLETHSQLTLAGGNVAARTWETPNLNLVGGTARVVDAGEISLTGGLSFGSEDSPVLKIEAGSVATLGQTGNGDLTLGFLNGDVAKINVEGTGRVSPESPIRQSELYAGNARIGNRGQGTFLVRDGGRAEFTGDVKVGEFAGAFGIFSVDGVVEAGDELFKSEIYVGNRDDGITADLELGNSGEAYMNVMNGGLARINGDTYLGQNAGGSANLTVANANLGHESFFDADGDIHIGGGGSGNVSLFDGGVITANTIHVESGGSYYQDGGIMAAQTLEIADGDSAWINDGQAYLQNFARTGSGSFYHTGGNLNIQGGTAAFNQTYAFSGPNQISQPWLYIESGADATVGAGFRVGEQSGEFGQATVRGATTAGRSTLRSTIGGAGADLHVGRYGSGGLSIEDGGFVRIFDDTQVASEPGSFGVLSVLGTTQLSNGVIERAELDVTARGSQSSLYIGQKGHGILSLGQGGLVRVAGNTNVGSAAGSRGEIYVFTDENGLPAELDIAGNLNLGGAGEALMYLYDGGVVKADRLNMGTNSLLEMSGGLLSLEVLDASNGTTNFTGGEVDIDEIIGSVDFTNVTILPGDSPGAMEIYGKSTFDSTTLEIEIGGYRSGSEHDHLFVSDYLKLDGTLDVRRYDLGQGLFSPQPGDEFTIISSDNTIDGEFDAIGGDLLPGGLGWKVLYVPAEQPESVVLRAVSLFDTADFDLDVDVDSRDLAELLHDYGRNGVDTDFDGDTDGSDFLAWQQQYNGGSRRQQVPRRPMPAITAVPEPAGLVLMFLGLVGILTVERRN